MRLRGLATLALATEASNQQRELIVVSGHPILGTLTPTSMKRPLKRSVAGAWGTLPPGAVSLIRLKDVEVLSPRGGGEPPSDTTGDALWLSQLGKGRIVSANFYGQTWPELQEATGSRFTPLVVKWLAGRPVE